MRSTTLLICAAAMCLAFAGASLHSVDLRHETEAVKVVQEGDLITILLKENPTTGYVWRYENPFEKNSGVYHVHMDEYEANDNPNKMNGHGGKRAIVLKADKVGSDDFELVLVRSWEFKNFVERTTSNGGVFKMKDVPNAGYRKVTLTVQKD